MFIIDLTTWLALCAIALQQKTVRSFRSGYSNVPYTEERKNHAEIL